MKKLLLVLLFATFTLVLGIGNAKALVMDSVPILMIDGNDTDNQVYFTIFSTATNYNFGYIDNNTGTFTGLALNGTPLSWNGGDIVNFAIQKSNNTSEVYSLGKDATTGLNYASLLFYNDQNKIPWETSVNPRVSNDYWDSVNIQWGIPNTINNTIPGVSYVLQLGTRNGDGVAPAVPEPSSMMLLGMGVLGLLGFRRKKS